MWLLILKWGLVLIVLTFKGLLTQLWCFIYGSEDLKRNTRNPWLGGIIIRAISLCFGYSAVGELIQRNIFPLYHFLFRCTWHNFHFCRFKKEKGKLKAAPSRASTNYSKYFAGLGVRLCIFVCLMTFLWIPLSGCALCTAILMPIIHIVYSICGWRSSNK